MNLDHVFGALADPTRRAILARLALGEVTVSELAEPFNMSLPAVSKHLRVLEEAGLISKGREVNAQSIMGVMMFAAGIGTPLTVRADGPDDQAALDAVVALFEHKFDEGA